MMLSYEDVRSYQYSKPANWTKLNEMAETLAYLRAKYPGDMTDGQRVYMWGNGMDEHPVGSTGEPLIWDRRIGDFGEFRKEKKTKSVKTPKEPKEPKEPAEKKERRVRGPRAPRVRKPRERKQTMKVPKVVERLLPLNKEDLLAMDLQNLQEIKEFLDTNGIAYTQPEPNRFVFDQVDPDAKAYEIFYVASHLYPVAQPKLGIVGVGKNFFYNMFKANHENNRFMCFTKDFEWKDDRKREVLKSYWLYAANKIQMNFYARDMEVREVPAKDARAFESEHCFYGKRGASLNLGLYLKKDKHGFEKDTLMMIYTFGLNFFGKDNKIEVLRVGTRKFCNVAGGASKLLTHFTREYPVLKVGKQEIVTNALVFYSDSDHNSGSSMEQIGFEYVSSGSGFMNYWIEQGIAKHREPSKHAEIMEEMRKGKVIAIPNAGVKTFLMKIERDGPSDQGL